MTETCHGERPENSVQPLSGLELLPPIITRHQWPVCGGRARAALAWPLTSD